MKKSKQNNEYNEEDNILLDLLLQAIEALIYLGFFYVTYDFFGDGGFINLCIN